MTSEDGPRFPRHYQDARAGVEAAWLVDLPWRVGRSVARTVYAQVDEDPTKSDLLIGLFDTSELAAEAVRCHNASLLARGVLDRDGDDEEGQWDGTPTSA